MMQYRNNLHNAKEYSLGQVISKMYDKTWLKINIWAYVMKKIPNKLEQIEFQFIAAEAVTFDIYVSNY